MNRSFPSRRSLKSGHVLWDFPRPPRHNRAGDSQVTDKQLQACPRYEEVEQCAVLDYKHENGSARRGLQHGQDSLWQGFECFAWSREPFGKDPRAIDEIARRQSSAVGWFVGRELGDDVALRAGRWRWHGTWNGWGWGWCGEEWVSRVEGIKLDFLIRLLNMFFSAKALKLK